MRKRNVLKFAIRFALFAFCLLTFFFTSELGLYAKAPAVQQTQNSCLWFVQTQSNKFYFLGSLHLLKQDAYPLSAAVRNAYSDSQKIVFETDIAAMQEPEMQAKMLELGLYPQGQNLLQNLDTGTRQMLEKKMAELGLPLEQFSRFKPWLMALTLTTLELQKLGFNPIYGVDVHFFNKASADGKEVGALEAVAYQLNLFGQMDKQNQNAFLKQTLKDLEIVNKLAGDLVKFWKNGDAENLHDLLYESFKDHPDLHNRLLIQRNKKWVEKIETLMQENKNILFIVGAGHLVGPDSVVDLLKKRGYTVKQK